MARLVSLSGRVSHLALAGPVSESRRRYGAPTATRTLNFRVNDHPARFEGDPPIGDGDLVTIAGLEDRGVLQTLAIRNRSTGVDYGGASAAQCLHFGLAILLGVFTLAWGGLGLVFLGIALWVGSRLRRQTRALTMVRTAGPARGPVGA